MMTPEHPVPRRWMGRWLMFVAAGHTVVGLALFHPTLRAMAGDGLLDTVGTDPLRGAVAWFMLFGVVLFVLAQAVDAIELAGAARRRPLGWGLLGLCAAGIVLMPASGFWLALPPALVLLRSRAPG